MKKAVLTPSPAIDAEFRVPGSKSITNRALVCAALADGETLIENASFSDDSDLLVSAFRQLKIRVDTDPAGPSIRVRGGGLPAGNERFYMGNAGTSLRFLTSYLCLGQGKFVVDGNERMRERPIAGLVDALTTLSARIKYGGKEGFPPLEIQAGGLAGGSTIVRGDTSSQFVSSLLLSAPYAREPVDLIIEGETVSWPYIEMTLRVMKDFGVEASRKVPQGKYVPRPFTVDGDAAAAGYFWAMAAASSGRARVLGVGAASVQPEKRILKELAAMGCSVHQTETFIEVKGRSLRGIDADMKDHPDSVPAIAVAACFARGRTRIKNVRHLRFKETDRLAALTRELTKLGARVIEHADGLEIDPPEKIAAAEIETYGDHRMAMAFAVAGAVAPGIVIQDPDCVTKSFPGFWDELKKGGVGV